MSNAAFKQTLLEKVRSIINSGRGVWDKRDDGGWQLCSSKHRLRIEINAFSEVTVNDVEVGVIEPQFILTLNRFWETKIYQIEHEMLLKALDSMGKFEKALEGEQ